MSRYERTAGVRLIGCCTGPSTPSSGQDLSSLTPYAGGQCVRQHADGEICASAFRASGSEFLLDLAAKAAGHAHRRICAHT